MGRGGIEDGQARVGWTDGRTRKDGLWVVDGQGSRDALDVFRRLMMGRGLGS